MKFLSTSFLKFVIIYSVFIVFCSSNRYCVYRPVTFEKTKYVFGSDSLDVTFKESIQFVFTYYNVPFIHRDNKIFVSKRILADTNFIYNCTKKANDSLWVEMKKNE